MPKHGCVLPLVFTCVVAGGLLSPALGGAQTRPDHLRYDQMPIVCESIADCPSDANIACVSSVCRHTCAYDSDCPPIDYSGVTITTPTVFCSDEGLCEPMLVLNRPGYGCQAGGPCDQGGVVEVLRWAASGDLINVGSYAMGAVTLPYLELAGDVAVKPAAGGVAVYRVEAAP